MVEGPRTDVSDVSYFTYDNNRRRLFSIGADPDGPSGSEPHVATLMTYDPVGRVTEVDRGTTTVITGSDFAMSNWVQDKYDPVGNKILETTGDSSGSTRNTAVQFSYDADNRVVCTARRMNPVIFGNVGSLNPCSLGTAGSYGSDRITQMIYDAGGQLRQELRAVGTSFAQVYATHKYEPNGKEIAIADADAGVQIGVNYADALNELAASAHQTNYAYDGFDRLIKTTYADNTTDLILSYDDDGNVLSRHNRANQAFTYSYDALDRMKVKNASGSTNDVYYTYDLLNHPLTEHFVSATGAGLDNCYDLAGRLTATTASTASTTVPCDGTVFNTATAHTLSYQYDQAGNKARLTWPDGYYVNYSYDALNHMHDAIDSGGTHLATYGYDQLARRTVVQYPNTNDKALYAWSADGDDLNTLSQYFSTSANNVSFNNTFTPAHQWASGTISTAAYRFVETGSGSDTYAPVNGLNQYVNVDSGAANGHDCQGNAQMFSYDCKGNLTGDGTFTYTYDTENRLLTATSAGTSASYAYDPMGRRQSKTVSGTTTVFVDDGDTEVGEYDGTTGNLLRRYVPGPAIDDLIAMVDCTNATPPNCTGGGVVKTYFHTDKMGSVVAMSKSDGTLAEGPYTYDPYGNCVGGGSSCGSGEPYRFTGQRLDPETGLYYYRARYYSPALGRFLQTDPVGYKDDVDWYTYVGNDPTDKNDPTGLMFGDDPGTSQAYLDSERQFAQDNPKTATGIAVVGVAVGAAPFALAAAPAIATTSTLTTGANILADISLGDALGGTSAAAGAGFVAHEAIMGGHAFESAILDSLGLEKNTTRVYSSEGAAVPDAITDTAHIEVKAGKYVSNTRQMRIQRAAARAAGKEHVVVVKSGTKVSKPLKNNSVIVRCDMPGCHK